MLYRRTAGTTSTAGCATARARCSAVSSAPGCTTPSASNYQPSPRATGSVQNVRYLAKDVNVCDCGSSGTIFPNQSISRIMFPLIKSEDFFFFFCDTSCNIFIVKDVDITQLITFDYD